jgi:hypothetical protein
MEWPRGFQEVKVPKFLELSGRGFQEFKVPKFLDLSGPEGSRKLRFPNFFTGVAQRVPGS